MNRSLHRSIDNVLAFIGLVLSLPAIYFFTGSFLKYELNLLSNVAIFVPPPVVMIGGLLIAMILNLFSLYRYNANYPEGSTVIEKLRSRAVNAVIAGIALLFLTLLLSYVILENIAESKVV